MLQLVQSINLSGKEPLPDGEVRTIVKSAFQRTQKNKAQASASVLAPTAPATDKVEIWSDWTEEWLEYYAQKPSPMSCLLKAIDEDQQYSLKDKLGVFIGSGGTRKSYGLQNVIAENVLGYENRFIYSSMEMGKPETVNRFLDMYFPAVGFGCISHILFA